MKRFKVGDLVLLKRGKYLTRDISNDEVMIVVLVQDRTRPYVDDVDKESYALAIFTSQGLLKTWFPNAKLIAC